MKDQDSKLTMDGEESCLKDVDGSSAIGHRPVGTPFSFPKHRLTVAFQCGTQHTDAARIRRSGKQCFAREAN